MEPPQLVFLDTCVLHHAIRGREVLRCVEDSTGLALCTEDPAAHVDPRLRHEIDLLPKVADLARAGRVRLATHWEALWELFGTVPIGRRTSAFDGVRLEHIDPPVSQRRSLGSGYPSRAPEASTRAFLERIDHARYLALRRMCGAYQGNCPAKVNQLMDAFLVWCAESASAAYFLTTDFKLLGLVRAHKGSSPRIDLLCPSEFVSTIGCPPGQRPGPPL